MRYLDREWFRAIAVEREAEEKTMGRLSGEVWAASL
jgi:hypothetical protein